MTTGIHRVSIVSIKPIEAETNQMLAEADGGKVVRLGWMKICIFLDRKTSNI